MHGRDYKRSAAPQRRSAVRTGPGCEPVLEPLRLDRMRQRADIEDAYKWNLDDIYPDWGSWDQARIRLDQRIAEYAALKGTLAQGADRLMAAFRLNDDLGQLAYKAYFFPSLKHDEDQRDNSVNARKQQIQALLARWQQA